MTSLLVRPDPTRTDPARSRPLVLVATLGGAAAALAPLVVLMAVGVVGWFISDAGAHGTPRDGMRVASLAWLAGHGSGLTVAGVRIGLVPLGVTAITAWSMWRVGHRVGEAISGHGPDADRIADGERDFTVPTAVALFYAAYAVTAVVVTVLAAGTTDPSLPKVLGWSLALVGVFAGPAIASGSGRAAIWAALVPPAVRAGAAVALTVLAWLLAAATALWLVMLALHVDQAATMFSRLHTSPSEAGLYALGNAALAPNATLFAGSWLLGPGFAVGGATVVSPGLVVMGPLPVVPLLAALPDSGEGPGWVAALLLVPPLLAALAAGRALRGRLLRWDHLALAGCGGGLVAALAFTVLASVAGGAAGPGRMRHVGPFVPMVLTHSLAALGVGALVGAVAVGLWRRRAVSTDGPEGA